MEKDTLDIRASKFVTDPGYKYKDYSRDSYVLIRKGDERILFVPKSVTRVEPINNHEARFMIEAWFAHKNHITKEFFNL